MNILILTYQGDVAGSTYSISYLARGLASRGHNVYVGCRKESLLYSLLADSGVACIPMTFPSKTDISCMRKIAQIVSAHSIDIINAQSGKDRYLSMFAKLLFRFPARVIHTRRQMVKSTGGLMAMITHSMTSGIIAVSREVKQSMVDKNFHGDKIMVIPNGTPLYKYDRIDLDYQDEIRKRIGYQDSDIVIGVVSRLKDQMQLIKALPLLPFKVKVIFVGITRSDLPELDESMTGKHELYFEGIVPTEKALAYYGLFTVKVLPSRMEGLSQSLLEAMFMNIPVIATKAGGNISLIQHEETGFLFTHGHPDELARYIEILVRQKEVRQRIVTQAREMVNEEYSISRTLDQYEAYFRDIIRGKVSSVRSTSALP